MGESCAPKSEIPLRRIEHEDIAELLLERGANPNPPHCRTCLILYYLAACRNASLEFLEKLFAFGSRLGPDEAVPTTVVAMDRHNSQILTWLFGKGFSPELRATPIKFGAPGDDMRWQYWICSDCQKNCRA
jgi:hypothetical protein